MASAKRATRWPAKNAYSMDGNVGGWRWLGGGWVAGWLGGWVAGWLGGWVAGWLGGWVAGWLGGWVAGWLGGWVAGWLCGYVAVWLAQSRDIVAFEVCKCMFATLALRTNPVGYHFWIPRCSKAGSGVGMSPALFAETPNLSGILPEAIPL